jgi:hypothetical protein
MEVGRDATVTFDDDSSASASSDTSLDGGTLPGGTSSDASSDSSSDSSSDASSSNGSSDGTSSDDSSGGSSSQSAIGGWSDAVSGGWNSAERSVGSVRRIPLQGLTGVNQTPAQDPATTESAAGRAILCVPSSLDASNAIEVLLHLHGYNIGYRQRVASSLPNAGSVRDVLMDQIEDQLGSSGRPMIAILPQGTLHSGFSGSTPFNCNAFITEVLSAAVSAGVWPSAPSISRVVLSAHSGGGGSIAVMESVSGRPQLPTPMAALFLFEAINGPNELASETAYVTAQLNADLQAVQGSSSTDQLNYLKTSFRFRGVYNTQDDFYATNYATIKQTIQSFFSHNAAALGGSGSDLYAALSANYQVVTPSPYVAHDGIVGQGNLGQALAMLQ